MGPAKLLVKNHLNFEKNNTEIMSNTEIAFFTSPIGLGHATRDVAIAQLSGKTKVKFVTGSSAAKLVLDYGFVVQDSYRPPLFDVQGGALQGSLKWLWQYYQYYKECKKIAAKFIDAERPELIVSDEDFASVSIAQKKKIPTILITDILKTEFTSGFGTIIEKKMNSSMQKIIQKCDAVIMPEAGSDESNIKRVGPIVRNTTSARDKLRQKFGFTKKTILITSGGTDAGKFLIQKSIEAANTINGTETVLVSGPSIEITDDTIRNLGYVTNLHEAIYAADLVISLAGKSTIDEAKAYGTPGIFIPIKNHFEQEDNARHEGYSYDDVFRLRNIILEKLDSARNPLKSDGAQKAWKIIQQHL
jgi:UDP-N-acetylglucosamine--N-acetylmuramyl-(pentapeptide) pyrophosphoryl-undecaprenol N-acetylglucosamine transferase